MNLKDAIEAARRVRLEMKAAMYPPPIPAEEDELEALRKENAQQAAVLKRALCYLRDGWDMDWLEGETERIQLLDAINHALSARRKREES